jgi:ferritin-like protein
MKAERLKVMPQSTISIRVPEPAAQAFAEASEQDRMKLEHLLSLRLQELIERPPRPMSEIMDEIGARAEALGLTDAELESMLQNQ